MLLSLSRAHPERNQLLFLYRRLFKECLLSVIQPTNIYRGPVLGVGDTASVRHFKTPCSENVKTQQDRQVFKKTISLGCVLGRKGAGPGSGHRGCLANILPCWVVIRS